MIKQNTNHKLQITSYNNLTLKLLFTFFIAGLFFISSTNIFAQTKDLKPTAQSYFLEGNLLFNQGKYKEAIIKFKKAIELDTNMAQAYYNIGVVYQQEGNIYYNLAIKWYKEAIKKNNKLIHSYYNLGVIYFDIGDYKGALKQFEIARQLSPQDKSITDALRTTKKIIAKAEKSEQEKKKAEEEKKKSAQAALKQKVDTKKQQQLAAQNKNTKSATDNNKNQTNIKNKAENKKVPAQKSQQKSTNISSKQQTLTNKNTISVQKPLTPTVKAKQQTPNKNTKTTTKPNTSVLPQVKIKNVPPQKYQVAKIVTCKNVVNKNPVKETNLFSSKDKEVYLWMNFSNLNKKYNVNTKWYSPDGKVFFSTSGAINPAGGRYRYWVSKKLAGTNTANLKGKWKVEVILDNQKVGETEFQIGN